MFLKRNHNSLIICETIKYELTFTVINISEGTILKSMLMNCMCFDMFLFCEIYSNLDECKTFFKTHQLQRVHITWLYQQLFKFQRCRAKPNKTN